VSTNGQAAGARVLPDDLLCRTTASSARLKARCERVTWEGRVYDLL